MRHTELVRGYAVTHPAGPVRLPQRAGWDQLVYAGAGVVRLATGAGTWVLPPHRAAWVPSGVSHLAHVVGRAAMRTLYFPSQIGLLDRETCVLNVTRLVRELVLHLLRIAPLHADDPRAQNYVEVLRSLLDELPEAPLQLPAPRAEPAAQLAALLVAFPGDASTIEELARRVGASRRALERAFHAETAMTIGQWRQRLRLIVALERLAGGEPVGRVAAELGYATQSAFGAMFKAQLGVSPGAYFAGADRWARA